MATTIKEMIKELEFRLNHLEDISADNRTVLVKLVKQNNQIVKFLQSLEVQEIYQDDMESMDKLLTPTSFSSDKDTRGIKALVDELLDKEDELEEFEDELKKHRDKITPGQIGEA
jgi:vesicle coat complex subunit